MSLGKSLMKLIIIMILFSILSYLAWITQTPSPLRNKRSLSWRDMSQKNSFWTEVISTSNRTTWWISSAQRTTWLQLRTSTEELHSKTAFWKWSRKSWGLIIITYQPRELFWCMLMVTPSTFLCLGTSSDNF